MSDDGVTTVSVQKAAPRSIAPVPLAVLRRDIWLHGAIALTVLAYIVSAVAVQRPSGFNTFWDGWVYTAAEIIPVVAMLLCARRWPAQRLPWLLFSVGILLHAAGDLVYSFHDQNQIPIPSPATSDIIYLLSYVVLIVAMISLTQSHVGRVSVALRIEGIVIGLAVAALAALLWYGPVLSVSGSFWNVVLTEVYPVGNLILLVLLVSSLAPYGYRPNAPVALLLAAVGWSVFGDLVYFNQSSAGTYVSRTFLNVTWVIGLWLVALAATAVDRRRSGALRRRRPGERGVAWAPLVAGLVFVAVGTSYLIVPGLAAATMIIAVVGLVLAGVNLVLTKQETLRSAMDPDNVDFVTGLTTVTAFKAMVDQWLHERSDNVLGVIVLDIINFAGVNDIIGYSIADELLWVIGQRAKYRLGESVAITRLGGDHFAFAVTATSETEIGEMAQRIRAITADRFHLSGFSVAVMGRVGVAVAESDSTASELITRAEGALTLSTPPVDAA